MCIRRWNLNNRAEIEAFCTSQYQNAERICASVQMLWGWGKQMKDIKSKLSIGSENMKEGSGSIIQMSPR